jgi:transcription termination factor Rho
MSRSKNSEPQEAEIESAGVSAEGVAPINTAEDNTAVLEAPAGRKLGVRKPRRATAERKALEPESEESTNTQAKSVTAGQETQTKKTTSRAKSATSSQSDNDESRFNGTDLGRADKSPRPRSNGKQQPQRQSPQQQNQRKQRRQFTNQRETSPLVTREELAELKIAELRAKAAELELDITNIRKKDEIIDIVLAGMVRAEGFVECAGVLDLLPEGYGFLRATGYLPGEKDIYVGVSVVRRNGLRKGDYVTGQVRPARDNERFAAIQRVDSINGLPLEEMTRRPRFADLTPVYPDQRLLMEHGKSAITARTIDLVAPIGKGQRGLIVSPPKAGKTTILKDIAAAITANNPDVHLMCLLVDERPEEVTDMQRSIHGEVISSTFDMPSENHIAVAELVIERAKRLVEVGYDVVILLDSITRLARAYNLAQPASGRILSGGVDSTALYPPKRFLGAARNIEGGGSLTILASALIETGSKMDEVIFEEFKGTGNMELRLDRDLADRRIFPAIDPVSSGTRKEELLLDPQEAPLIWAVRRILANLNSTERSMEMLIKSLKQTQNNAEFLLRTAKRAQGSQRNGENMEL